MTWCFGDALTSAVKRSWLFQLANTLVLVTLVKIYWHSQCFHRCFHSRCLVEVRCRQKLILWRTLRGLWEIRRKRWSVTGGTRAEPSFPESCQMRSDSPATSRFFKLPQQGSFRPPKLGCILSWWKYINADWLQCFFLRRYGATLLSNH